MKKNIQNLFYKSCALMIAVPISLNGSIPVPAYQTETKTIEVKTEKVAKLALDKQNPETLTLVEKQLEIKPVESNFDREQRIAREEAKKATKRDVISRERLRYIQVIDPDLSQKRALVQAAASRYGIPWQVLEAVWQVETGKSWDTAKRSYAGAAGPMQFMRGTWEKYKIDANGDGTADITCAYDAVYGAANLLARAGAASGQVDRALYSYNHSSSYVRKVLSIAHELGY